MTTRSFDVTRLATDEVCFRRLDDTLTLSLQDGRYYPRVEVRRCFPMSEDSRYISVRDATTEDKDEIGLIEAGQTPSHFLDPHLLSKTEQDLLKESFQAVAKLQDASKRHFSRTPF